MKKTDIAMVVLIASVSILIAFFGTRAIFGGSPNEAVKVKTIERIDSSIEQPSTDIFNPNGINPTYRVNVGNGETTSDTTQTEPVE
jgi:ABC-type cobalt transport system substrate-binding protein